MLMTSVVATPVIQRQKFLRLSFDGGCRGVNGLASGGAILHLCNAPNTADDGCDTIFDEISSDIICDFPERSAEVNNWSPRSSSDVRRRSSKQRQYYKLPSSAQIGKVADSNAEIEVWKGSFFFGDGLSSHLAEYLSLIEGLYALRMILKENQIFHSESNDRGLTQPVDNDKNDLKKSFSRSYSSSENNFLQKKRINKSFFPANSEDSEYILQNKIFIRGDSEIIIKNLNKKYIPKDRTLRSTHILADALLSSLLHSYCNISSNVGSVDYNSSYEIAISESNGNSGLDSESDMTSGVIKGTYTTPVNRNNYDNNNIRNYDNSDDNNFDYNSDKGNDCINDDNGDNNNDISNNSKTIQPYDAHNNHGTYVLYHVHRHDNSDADKLSSEALKSQKSYSHYSDNSNCFLKRNNFISGKEGKCNDIGVYCDQSKNVEVEVESQVEVEVEQVHMHDDILDVNKCFVDDNVIIDNITNNTSYYDDVSNSLDCNSNINYEGRDKYQNDNYNNNDNDENDNDNNTNNNNNRNNGKNDNIHDRQMTQKKNIGGILFLKLSSNNIPQYLISTVEQMDCTLTANNISISVPFIFESEKKIRDIVLGEKKFQKKIQNPHVTMKNNIYAKKYKKQKQDILSYENKNKDFIIYLDNLCFNNENNKKPEIRIDIFKRKMNNIDSNISNNPNTTALQNNESASKILEIVLLYDIKNNILCEKRKDCYEPKVRETINTDEITAKSTRTQLLYTQDRPWHMTIPLKLPGEHSEEHSEESFQKHSSFFKGARSKPKEKHFSDIQISFFSIPVLPYFNPSFPLSFDANSLYLDRNSTKSDGGVLLPPFNSTSSSSSLSYSSSSSLLSPPPPPFPSDLLPSSTSTSTSSPTSSALPLSSLPPFPPSPRFSILKDFLIKDKTRNDEEDSIMVR